MFNPVSAAELVTAIGRTAHDAAGAEGELSGFARVQLKSAYSATRHLRVELESFGPELDAFCGRVAEAARGAAAELPTGARSELERLAARLTAPPTGAPEPQAAADAACEILDRCRRRVERPWPALRETIRSALRELCDREVELLSASLEAGRG